MKWKKPRGFRTEDMLYADRCMLKWHGMLLSDHNERISSDEISEKLMADAVHFCEDELQSWDMVINEAINEKKDVRILIKKEGKPMEEISALPLGISGNNLLIRLNGLRTKVNVGEILSVLPGCC